MRIPIQEPVLNLIIKTPRNQEPTDDIEINRISAPATPACDFEQKRDFFLIIIIIFECFPSTSNLQSFWKAALYQLYGGKSITVRY